MCGGIAGTACPGGVPAAVSEAGSMTYQYQTGAELVAAGIGPAGG